MECVHTRLRRSLLAILNHHTELLPSICWSCQIEMIYAKAALFWKVKDSLINVPFIKLFIHSQIYYPFWNISLYKLIPRHYSISMPYSLSLVIKTSFCSFPFGIADENGAVQGLLLRSPALNIPQICNLLLQKRLKVSKKIHCWLYQWNIISASHWKAEIEEKTLKQSLMLRC